MRKITRREALRMGGALALSPALLAASGGTVLAQQKRDPYARSKLVDGPPPMPAKGSFTIAVLPDTQLYCEYGTDHYNAQTQWLVDQKKDRNIACVLHLGDITNRNTVPQWEHAVKAMNVLDDQLPYFLATGNHDYGEGGRTQDRSTYLNEYFPLDKFSGLPTFGGVYDKEPDRLDNSYHRFTAGGRNFLVISLEFGPRKDVVRWANEVAAAHKDHAAILITHAYMYFNETRYDWAKYGEKQLWNPHSYPVAEATNHDVHDGEELWRELVSKHENFIMTLNGHVGGDGLAHLDSSTPGGRIVPQMLVDYQIMPNGGDGWLRLIEMREDLKTAMIYDYSPTLDQQNASSQSQFEIRLDMPAV